MGKPVQRGLLDPGFSGISHFFIYFHMAVRLRPTRLATSALFQFTNISRPGVIHEEPQGGLGETLDLLVRFFVMLGD